MAKMAKIFYLLAIILFCVSGNDTAKGGCQGCSKTNPPGVEGFNEDKIESTANGCLTRTITCNPPNYVIYYSSSGTVSQADPSLTLVCNEDSQWITRDEKWDINSVDCHNSTEPKKPKSVCKLEKITGMCKAYFPSFYFDNAAKECKEFIYGGCQGNGNRFWTKEQCESTCLDKN